MRAMEFICPDPELLSSLERKSHNRPQTRTAERSIRTYRYGFKLDRTVREFVKVFHAECIVDGGENYASVGLIDLSIDDQQIAILDTREHRIPLGVGIKRKRWILYQKFGLTKTTEV